MENNEIFNLWKDNIENVNIFSQIDCLRIIELNICNKCNLKCWFCPHSDNYQYDIDYIDLSIMQIIKQQLDNINYNGYICIAGHGEPTLHPYLLDILNILQPYKIVLVSNGIPLTSNDYLNISKLCQIKISIHDISKKYFFDKKFINTNAIFRNHDINNPQMNLYNRAGNIYTENEKIFHKCNYPFYKIMIDIDGTYKLCEADWKKITTTEFNIFNIDIKKYFCTYLNNIRKKILINRQLCNLCKNCNINGELIGNKFVNFWKNNNV